MRLTYCLILALAFAALAPMTVAHAADRGTLLDSHRTARLSRAETAALAKSYGLPAARVRHGVDAFRLRYATVAADGGPTSASGLLLLPRGARGLPTVSYAHGTMAARADAPSRSLDSLAGASALLFAGAGFATAAPDYLGLGSGPGRHPYMHAASEASASLDMLRAARAFAARRHRTLDPRTLVTGFSQGGQAAMALGRVLQEGGDPVLRLQALAPMSGPFAIERAELPALLAGRLDPAAANYYVSYLMRAWQPLYHVFGSSRDVWRGPWGARTARLYDGRHDDVAILRRLPHRLSRLFTPGFRVRLAHPDGGLAAGLRENDATCEWRPLVPVRLYAARGDRQVAFANSRRCAAELRAHGAPSRLVNMGAVDHFPSTVLAVPKVLRWFQQLSRP